MINGKKLRICRRCHKFYETTCIYSRYCPHCYKNKRLKNPITIQSLTFKIPYLFLKSISKIPKTLKQISIENDLYYCSVYDNYKKLKRAKLIKFEKVRLSNIGNFAKLTSLTKLGKEVFNNLDNISSKINRKL